MIAFLKFFLPIYLVVFIGLSLLWRSYIAWKQTGVNPFKLGSGDTVDIFIGRLLGLTLMISIFIVFAFSFSERLYVMLVPITWLNSPNLTVIGIILLLVALVWVLIAQIQMGDSWRIGIDEETPSPLVQSGLFGVSRNPIFLGMIIMLVGLLLTIPTAATLVVTVLGIILIHIQVRFEESFLVRKYGEKYRRYQSHVRRWI